MQPILPGSTIGILGGGQLGRMLALQASQMGYKVISYTQEQDSPISQVCAKTIVASFEDRDALALFAKQAQVVTIEFENIPVASYTKVGELTRIAPSPSVLQVTQNRELEKSFLVNNGFPVAPYCVIKTQEDLQQSLAKISFPAVLKTIGYGYDGKGQKILHSTQEAIQAFQESGAQEYILESLLTLKKELSVIAARTISGEMKVFGPIESLHKKHILDLSSIPAQINKNIAAEAIEISTSIMRCLDVVGVFCIEFFLIDNDKLLVNELAPRVHNSGHYSIEACPTSQFEQHIRAITGLPLGNTEPHSAAAMANLLGDLWLNGEPKWSSALEMPDVHLHLYGKKEARPGRKMGHLTACAHSSEEARALVLKARNLLTTATLHDFSNSCVNS